ncbi:hypothetical protein [Herbidospora sp. RD11066]
MSQQPWGAPPVQKPVRRFSSPQFLVAAGVVVVTVFGAGYYTGREVVKAELRNSIAEAFSGLGADDGPTAAPQPTETVEDVPEIDPAVVGMLTKVKPCPDSIGSMIVCQQFTNKTDDKVNVEVEFVVETTKGKFTANATEFEVRPGVKVTLNAYVHDEAAAGAKMTRIKQVLARIS